MAARTLHRQPYVPTEEEHRLIEQTILNYPRQIEETRFRNWVIFKLASLTGMRINEVLNIEIKHINLGRRIITIPAENSKNRVESFVYICDELMTILKDYLEKYKPDKYLFYNFYENELYKGKKISVQAYHKCWKKYLTSCNLNEIKFLDKLNRPRQKIAFHSATRTYFINRLFKNNPNLNISELSRISRHRSIDCLYNYYLRFNDFEIWQKVKI